MRSSSIAPITFEPMATTAAAATTGTAHAPAGTVAGSRRRWTTRRVRFVFLHHLIGGLNRDVRGGIVNVPYLRWGGKTAMAGWLRKEPPWAGFADRRSISSSSNITSAPSSTVTTISM